MSDDYRPIETAPRDGTVIEVFAEDAGAFLMRWNPSGENCLVSKSPGIWECPGGNFTWCEDDGFGPEWWRPAVPRSALAPDNQEANRGP